MLLLIFPKSRPSFFLQLQRDIVCFCFLFLFYLGFTSKIKREKIIFSLIIGGALGNFYDRIIFRAVPDFIDIHYKNFHWFTFNAADIFISVGIITFIIIGNKEI